MNRELSPQTARPVRKDALRNRETLVAVARSSFASATDDTVPLEEIARAAGLGIGTLYRHFPTRESLVEAVYSAELDDVTARADTLLAELPPDRALDEWMKGYAEFVATKRGMLDTLRAGWASGRIATPTTRERITASIAKILSAGARAGIFRDDVQADDVAALLVGVFLSNPANSAGEQSARLRGLVIDALRPRPDAGLV